MKIIEHIYNNKNSTSLNLIIQSNVISNIGGHVLVSIAMSLIPTFAYKVTINDITYYSEFGKCEERFKHVPIPSIIDNTKIDETHTFEHFNMLEELYYNKMTPQVINNVPVLKMLCSFTNNTNEEIILYSNNKNITYVFNNKQINNIYNNKIPIKVIKPKHKIVFSCTSELGIALYNYIWTPITLMSKSIQIDDDKINIILYSRGQLNEYEILIRSIIILLEKITLLKKIFIDNMTANNIININNNSNNNEKIIKISNFNLNIIELVVSYIQKHKKINYAHYNNESILTKKCNIIISIIENVNESKIIMDIFDELYTIYFNLKEQIEQLQVQQLVKEEKQIDK